MAGLAACSPACSPACTQQPHVLQTVTLLAGRDPQPGQPGAEQILAFFRISIGGSRSSRSRSSRLPVGLGKLAEQALLAVGQLVLGPAEEAGEWLAAAAGRKIARAAGCPAGARRVGSVPGTCCSRAGWCCSGPGWGSDALGTIMCCCLATSYQWKPPVGNAATAGCAAAVSRCCKCTWCHFGLLLPLLRRLGQLLSWRRGLLQAGTNLLLAASCAQPEKGMGRHRQHWLPPLLLVLLAGYSPQHVTTPGAILAGGGTCLG